MHSQSLLDGLPTRALTWAHAACRWVWLGVGVLIFANLLFLTITILAHQFLDSFEGSNTTVSEDMLNERAYAAKGHTDPNAGPEVVISVKVRRLSMDNCEAQDHACGIFQEQQGLRGDLVGELLCAGITGCLWSLSGVAPA